LSAIQSGRRLKALAFERAEPASVTAEAAQAWIRRSRLRLPLDLVTCAAMLCMWLGGGAAARLIRGQAVQIIDGFWPTLRQAKG